MTLATQRPSDTPYPDPPLPDTTRQEPIATTIARLRETFATGRTRDVRWRDAQLAALAQLMREQEEALTEALIADLDRTPDAAWVLDIATVLMEISYARKHLRSWVRPRHRATPAATWPSYATLVPEPLGTVLIIGAWNYPLSLTLGPLVAALSAGNTAVVKPSEFAPATSAALARLLPLYLDSAAVAVVQGAADEVQELLTHPFDHCLFTGSGATGQRVLRAAAETMTPVTLELGGKSPVIIAADADLEVAARRVAWGKLTNSGQTCIACDYVLVEASVRDEFVALLTATLAEFSADRPEGQPIVNARQFNRIRGLIESADGSIALGGGVDENRRTIEPTVIIEPSHDSAVMTEEIFGPVLPIISVGSIDQAIDHVRAGDKPLATYVFTSSAAVRRRVVERISTGAIVFNHVLLHNVVSALPFGGVGASGVGSYHGKWGFDTFSHVKPVLRAFARPDVDIIYPPVTDLKRAILRLALR